ncbi:hypothetical protein JLBYU27_17 [Escherichia phage JLBYU27]|nr:hypothetical protein JLBYU27_17 [Escherichia phage JLBYU27]
MALSRRCEAINADPLLAPVRSTTRFQGADFLATNGNTYYITPKARSRAGGQTLETEQMLIGGFSQEFIYLHMCELDYKQNGIATVCDGDTKTIEEIEETEQ